MISQLEDEIFKPFSNLLTDEILTKGINVSSVTPIHA
jgi:hypothetical protein